MLKVDNVFTKMLRGAVSAGFIPQSPCRDIRLPRVEREEMRFLTPEEIRRLADAIGPRYRGLVLVMAYGGLRWGEAAGLRVPRLHLPPTASPLRSLWRTRFFHPAVEAAGLAPLRVHDLRHTAVALGIASGAHVREIQSWAGHASVASILNTYGHVFETSGDRVEGPRRHDRGRATGVRCIRDSPERPPDEAWTAPGLSPDGGLDSESGALERKPCPGPSPL